MCDRTEKVVVQTHAIIARRVSGAQQKPTLAASPAVAIRSVPVPVEQALAVSPVCSPTASYQQQRLEEHAQLALTRQADPIDPNIVIIGGRSAVRLDRSKWNYAMSRHNGRKALFAFLDHLFSEDGKPTLNRYSFTGKGDKKPLKSDPSFLAALDEVQKKFPTYNITSDEINAISAKCKNSK